MDTNRDLSSVGALVSTLNPHIQLLMNLFAIAIDIVLIDKMSCACFEDLPVTARMYWFPNLPFGQRGKDT